MRGDGCPTPGKRRYESKKVAKFHLRQHRKIGRENLRPYLCACGWWHLGHHSPLKPRITEEMIVAALGLTPEEEALMRTDTIFARAVRKTLSFQGEALRLHIHALGMALSASLGLIPYRDDGGGVDDG